MKISPYAWAIGAVGALWIVYQRVKGGVSGNGGGESFAGSDYTPPAERVRQTIPSPGESESVNGTRLLAVAAALDPARSSELGVITVSDVPDVAYRWDEQTDILAPWPVGYGGGEAEINLEAHSRIRRLLIERGFLNRNLIKVSPAQIEVSANMSNLRYYAYEGVNGGDRGLIDTTRGLLQMLTRPRSIRARVTGSTAWDRRWVGVPEIRFSLQPDLESDRAASIPAVPFNPGDPRYRQGSKAGRTKEVRGFVLNGEVFVDVADVPIFSPIKDDAHNATPAVSVRYYVSAAGRRAGILRHTRTGSVNGQPTLIVTNYQLQAADFAAIYTAGGKPTSIAHPGFRSESNPAALISRRVLWDFRAMPVADLGLPNARTNGGAQWLRGSDRHRAIAAVFNASRTTALAPWLPNVGSDKSKRERDAYAMPPAGYAKVL